MEYTKINDVKAPCGNRQEDVGIDFFIPTNWNEGKPYILRMNEQVNINSGIKTKFSKTLGLIGLSKSGVATRKGCIFGAHVIDSGYRNFLHLNLFKVVKGSEDIRVRRRGLLGWLGFKEWATVLTPGEKIIQFALIKISNEELKEISEDEYSKGPKTKRNLGGFGSTGTK